MPELANKQIDKMVQFLAKLLPAKLKPLEDRIAELELLVQNLIEKSK